MARSLTTRPPSQRARVIPASYFKTECASLERAVRALNLATPAELDPHRPGGAENAATDAYGWLAYYRRLQRLHARVEHGGSARASAPSPDSASAVDNEIVLAALRLDPVRVELVDSGQDVPRTLVVRPLSEHALLHLDARDDLLRCLARHAHQLQASLRPDELEIRLQVVEEIAYQQRVCVWICTSEAWPRLPFDPLSDPRPAPPDALDRLHPFDTMRVQAAHHRLNAQALTVARRIVSLPDDPTAPSSSWRTFFATLESESNGTIPASDFMRNRALVSLLASRIIAADAEAVAYERAREKAKEEAERERGQRR